MGNRGLVALLLCGVFSIAHAQATPSPWYIGAGLGASSGKMNDTDFPNFGGATTHVKDDSGTTYKLFAGYRFNSYFAVEGSYSDLGKSSVKENGLTLIAPGGPILNPKSEHSHKAWTLWAVGVIPITQHFNVFGKLGASSVRTHLAVSHDGTAAALAFLNSSKNVHKTNTAFGLGGEYNLTDKVALRLEYEDFGKVGNPFNSTNDVGRSKVSAWSLGVGYRF